MKEKQEPLNPKEPPKKQKTGKANSKSKRSEIELPYMVEMAFRLPMLVILGADGIMVGLSYSAGATWTDIFVRVVVTTILMGGMLLMLSWALSSSALAAEMSKQELAAQSASKPPEDRHGGQPARIEMEKEA